MFQDANIDLGGLYHCLSSMGLIAPPRITSASLMQVEPAYSSINRTLFHTLKGEFSLD